ncbi:hypothetical protein, partial [Nocardia seriolae]|uniref:hypothetical protein n=1 Tax=Nocardia seriolae TaxID=37332 RepID=UPI001E55D101
ATLQPDTASELTIQDTSQADVIALYRTLESRYGHQPVCGEPYPKDASGQLNTNVLNHKALSCTDICTTRS